MRISDVNYKLCVDFVSRIVVYKFSLLTIRTSVSYRIQIQKVICKTKFIQRYETNACYVVEILLRMCGSFTALLPSCFGYFGTT